MQQRIVVINPNSTRAVTDAISAALEPLRFSGGPSIECVTLAEGPPGIETAEHVRSVIGPMRELALAKQTETDAFVIACYSDPGLSECRQALHRPVFGMAESGMLMALSRGRRFGVLSLFEASVQRHVAYVEKLGLSQRMAGDLPVNLGVLELGDENKTLRRLTSVGERLVEEHGADVVLMGCAGMSAYRGELEHSLKVPVIDPTQAAVSMAIGTVRSA